MISEVLSAFVIIALLLSFLLILAGKIGITRMYQLYRPSWMPQSCNFCALFWGACIVVVIAQALNLMPQMPLNSYLANLILSAMIIAPLALFFYNKK